MGFLLTTPWLVGIGFVVGILVGRKHARLVEWVVALVKKLFGWQ